MLFNFLSATGTARMPGLSTRRAFSLVELLVVVAVLGIVATFAIPAATSILRATSVTRGGAVVEQTMMRARQLALSQNRNVEVRLYQYDDEEILGDDKQFRGLQIVMIEDDGTPKPSGKVQVIPSGAAINESSALSPLISDRPTNSGSSGLQIPKVGSNYDWVSVTFRPDGSTDLDQAGGENGKWFLTVHDGNYDVSESAAPENYYTVQIEPLLGSVRGHRP